MIKKKLKRFLQKIGTKKSAKAMGVLIIIVAPSGAGKSTLIKRIKKEFTCLHESISFTTRPMRAGETHGVQYFFISKDEFRQKIDHHDFLEWATVHSNYYGTSRSFIEGELQKGHHILLDVDVQGADAIKAIFKNRAKAIFIIPPSIDELRKRLISRGTDSLEVIEERVKNAEREMKKKEEYDFHVVNDDLERAYNELVRILKERILIGR